MYVYKHIHYLYQSSTQIRTGNRRYSLGRKHSDVSITKDMKVIWILAVFLAAVNCETCHHDDECQLVHCSTGSVNCIHHICTCTENTGQVCTGQDDCRFHCFHGQPHCVDGLCHCYGD